MFDPSLSERMMKFRLFKDIRKGSKLAKSRFTGKKYVIYIELMQQENANGIIVHVDILSSKFSR